MIILSLPWRESFWFSLCQRENLLEAKPVDVRLRRNKGREGKSFSDLVRRKQRLVTAKQFSLPRLRSDSVVRRPWKGAQTSCHQQTTQEAKPRTGKCCHELDEGCLGWCATRGQRRDDDAQRASQPADLKEHVHHTRHELFWARASRIRYGRIQTKLRFRLRLRLPALGISFWTTFWPRGFCSDGLLHAVPLAGIWPLGKPNSRKRKVDQSWTGFRRQELVTQWQAYFSLVLRGC